VEAQRQASAVAASAAEHEDQGFIDSLAEGNDVGRTEA
jgi:hypothetical protein